MTGSIREATAADVPALARLRTEGGWAGGADAEVMSRYLAGEHHPRHALAPRAMFLATEGAVVSGFIAGHRTERFGCHGELQWIFVAPAHRGIGVADRLFERMASWFVTHDAERVCVNVEPHNAAARRFYARHGAVELSEHWMVWDHISR